MSGDATLAAARPQENCAAETSGRGSNLDLANLDLGCARSSYCAEGECGIQGPRWPRTMIATVAIAIAA